MSCQNSVIMGRATVQPGQIRMNGHARPCTAMHRGVRAIHLTVAPGFLLLSSRVQGGAAAGCIVARPSEARTRSEY